MVPGDGRGDPAFDAYQMFVAGRQRIGGDQDPQVLDRFTQGEFIQAGVSHELVPPESPRSLALEYVACWTNPD